MTNIVFRPKILFMSNVKVRRGRPEDARHFAELVVLTSPMLFPALFGSTVKNLMKNIFKHKRHYFSFDHSYFAEVDGKMAGMAQLHKRMPVRKERTRLSLLLLKYMNWRLPAKIANLLKSERGMWFATGKDCYLSSVAVYPEFRGQGIGTKLLEAVEDEARSIGKKRIVLKADTHNQRAINLYERLGYRIEQRTTPLKLKKNRIESFIISKSV